MKKFIKNILIFALLISMLALCACHETPVTPDEPDGPITLNVEDFVIFEGFGEKLKMEFVNENLTYGGYYDTDGDGSLDTSPKDTVSYPKTREIVITSQSEYDQIFTDQVDSAPMDYDKEMYILFVFTDDKYYGDTFFAIRTATLTTDTLEIDFAIALYDPEKTAVSHLPIQRFAMIRMEKTDVENVVLTKVANDPEPSDDPLQNPDFTGTLISPNEYVVFDNFANKINEDFIKENPTALLTRKYFNPITREWVYPPDDPTERVILIQSQSEYDQVFSAAVDPEPMDYTKEMYVLYTFTTHRMYSKLITEGIAAGYYGGYTFVIERAVIENNELQIDCKIESAYKGDTVIEGGLVNSYQRFALIRMDKQDVENIVFKLKDNPL